MSNSRRYDDRNLREMLGIDYSDPRQRLARDLVGEKEGLLDWVVHHRKEQGITQEDLAASMGVQVEAVQRIETGERDPRLSTLTRYAFAINCLVTHEVRVMDTGKRRRWTRLNMVPEGVNEVIDVDDLTHVYRVIDCPGNDPMWVSVNSLGAHSWETDQEWEYEEA